MKYLFFIMLFIAVCTNATPIVNNSGSTTEDSVCFIFHNPDSLGQPLGGLDTTKILVIGPSGDSVFAEVVAGVSGRVGRRSTGNGVYDTTYYWKAAVADVDGSGSPGMYSVRLTAVSNQSGNYLRFTSIRQFQITAVDLSDALDSAGISAKTVASTGVVLANDAITAAKIAADAIGASEIAADAITSSEIAATAAAEIADASGDSVWSATVTSVANRTVTVTTNNDKTGYTASTVSDKTGYSLATAPLVPSDTAALRANIVAAIPTTDLTDVTDTVNAIIDSLNAQSSWVGHQTTIDSLLDSLNSATIALAIRLDSAFWTLGGAASWTISVRHNDADTMFMGKATSDTLMYRVYYHTGGYPGKYPDSTRTYEH